MRAPGWDSIDEVKANMLGWKSYSFEELRVVHHRLTGTADGLLRDRIKHGVACYVSGYHPFLLSRAAFQGSFSSLMSLVQPRFATAL